MIEMKICPTCGSLLTAKLVDAVANPFRSETCPKAKIVEKKVTNKKTDKKVLKTLLGLGAKMTDGEN